MLSAVTFSQQGLHQFLSQPTSSQTPSFRCCESLAHTSHFLKKLTPCTQHPNTTAGGKCLLALLLAGTVLALTAVWASKLPVSSSQGKGTLPTRCFSMGCFTQVMNEQATCSFLLLKLIANAQSHICMGHALQSPPCPSPAVCDRPPESQQCQERRSPEALPLKCHVLL